MEHVDCISAFGALNIQIPPCFRDKQGEPGREITIERSVENISSL